MRSITLLPVVAIAFAGCGPPAPAELSGDACTVERTVLAELEGPRVNRFGVGVVTDDRMLFASNVDLASIEVFGRDGRHQTTLGGRGEGPGEYQGVLELSRLSDGRIAAVDGRVGRITIYSPELELQRTFPVPVLAYPHGAVPLASGDWILSGMVTDRAHYRSAAVLVDSLGSALTYFGDGPLDLTGGGPERPPTRLVAHDPDHGVVTVQTNDYALELWSDAGPLAERIEIDAPWFTWPPEWLDEARDEPETPTGPVGRAPLDHVAGMQFDEEGRLWILSQVTPSTWRDGVDEQGRVVDQTRFTDFMLHVYDVGNRRSICRTRIEDTSYFGGFAGPRILKTYEEDGSGSPRVEVHRFRLVESLGSA